MPLASNYRGGVKNGARFALKIFNVAAGSVAVLDCLKWCLKGGDERARPRVLPASSRILSEGRLPPVSAIARTSAAAPCMDDSPPPVLVAIDGTLAERASALESAKSLLHGFDVR